MSETVVDKVEVDAVDVVGAFVAINGGDKQLRFRFEDLKSYHKASYGLNLVLNLEGEESLVVVAFKSHEDASTTLAQLDTVMDKFTVCPKYSRF